MEADIGPIQQEATEKVCHQEMCIRKARAREYALGIGEAGVCFAHGNKVEIPIMTCSYANCKDIARVGNTCELHADKGITGSILSPDLTMVEGCGMPDVNGIYERDGKLAIPYCNKNRDKKYDSVYKYTKQAVYSGESTIAIHNGEEVVFTLYRREFGWQISILDTEHGLECHSNSTVTFYAHELLVHVPEKHIKLYKGYDDDDYVSTEEPYPDAPYELIVERGYSKSVYDNDKYPLPAESRVSPRDSWEVKGSGIGPPPMVYITPTNLPSINDYQEQITGASYKLYYLSNYGTNTRRPSNKVITTALKACGIPPSIFQSNETSHASLVDQLLKLVKQTLKTLKPNIQWRESEVLMNIKSNNLQLYNCVVRHEAIYNSKERQQVGSQYPHEHKRKNDKCGNDYFIRIEPTSDECIFTNKSYPSIINKGFVWSVIIPYQGKLRRFGQYENKKQALKARYAALKVLMSCPNSNQLNKQQIEENVNQARDAVVTSLQQYSDELYITQYEKRYGKKPSFQQLSERFISIRYRGYRGIEVICPCKCQITANPKIIQTIKTNKSKMNECSDVSNSIMESGKSTDYNSRRHHYKSVGGSIRKSDQIAGVDIHRKMEILKHSLMKKAVRFIEKHDPEEDGSLRKELDELLKTKKSGSSGKKSAEVIPDLYDIDRIVKKHGVHAAAAALRTQKVKIGRIQKRKLAK